MKYKNSFFRIETKPSGTYLDVFPPQKDGKKIDVDEVLKKKKKKKDKEA